MRGDRRQGAIRVPEDHPLRMILEVLSLGFNKQYARVGRPSKGLMCFRQVG